MVEVSTSPTKIAGILAERNTFVGPVDEKSNARWEQALGALRAYVQSGAWSLTRVAADLGMTHSALSRILSGETKSPHARTRMAIVRWVVDHQDEGPTQPATSDENAGRNAPEEELLEYFVQNHEQMAIFMATTTDGLSAEDRRKVALAILNGFKKLAIQAGEPIPDVLYEIERKFVRE